MERSKITAAIFSFFLILFQTGWTHNNESTELFESAIENNIMPCTPGQGLMWVTGALDEEIAVEIEEALRLQGFKADVEARGYGEIDNCGTYSQKGLDFKVTLATNDNQAVEIESIQINVDNVEEIVGTYAGENPGNIVILDNIGNRLNGKSLKVTQTQSLDNNTLTADPITKNVYVIIYDPLLSNGQTLSQYMHWNDPLTITQQTIDFFQSASNGKMIYSVSFTSTVNNGWPELIDGYIYTESSYMEVLGNPNLHHTPTEVNYTKIIDDPAFDICGKVNRGEIDEVWIYNGPWFGFYESRLVGPDAYTYNSPPLSNSNCSEMVPVMGPSMERTVHEAVHNFTHRAEATMSKVYGGWAQNRTDHNWDRFGLVKAQSPNYSYSGCGSSHYPPNGTQDYDYSNTTNALSNCEDFLNFPNLENPLLVVQPVNCTAWGCNGLGYYDYWFSHFPAADGCTDYISNNWWKYFADPSSAVVPARACGAFIISGNAGVGMASLNYSDDKPRTVTADNLGNYSLPVMNGWSGAINPQKTNYSFSPTILSFTNVSSDIGGQNFTASITCPAITEWKGEYWGNTSMTGAPILCRNDASINFPWGSGSPDPGISADNFSARWTRTMQFAPGLYRFRMSHDDGARLYIDDVIKIDAWGTCCVWDQVDVSLSGNHTIRMEMFENSGGAGAQLDITTLSLYQPEIEIRGNNVVILDGDSSASTTDHTNFGSANTSESTLTRTFTIRNIGQSDLALDGNPIVEISGTNSSDFTVTSQLSSPVAPLGSTTFTVLFDPSASGVRNATVSIANNDSNENPYNFVVQGTGVASPEIDVRGNGSSILNGDVTPSSADFTNFGNAEVAGNVVSRVFTIHNIGDSSLNLTGSPNKVSISGSNSSDFTLSAIPLSPITPGTSSTFTITFTPSATGVRNATVTIPSNDANENPFTFSIQGNGLDTTTFAVNTIADDDDGNCDSFVSGVSGCSLREALALSSNGDTITFDPSLAGQTVQLQSTLTMDKSIVIDASALTEKIILSGDSDNDGDGDILILNILANRNVTIKNVEFTKGYTNTNISTNAGAIANLGNLRVYDSEFNSNHGEQGGAIRNSGQLLIENSSFTNNAGVEGGAILNNINAQVEIRSSTFSTNQANNSNGLLGGGGAIVNIGFAEIEDSEFTNNTADYSGGGIVNSFAGTLTISGSTFTDNESIELGGAIHNFEGHIEVDRSTFINNDTAEGGAILNDLDGTAVITNSIFRQNTATIDAGAIGNIGTITVTGSEFSQNSATLDAGGAIVNGIGGIAVIANSTISGNSSVDGGGVAMGDPDTITTLINVTISNNTGGGLYIKDGIAHITNSILANNNGNPDCYLDDGSVNANVKNIILVNGSGSTSCGTPFSGIDPLIDSLSLNGGVTQTMALLPGSPAINAGDDAACNALPVGGIDQRGITRPQGSHCDIGAFEYQDTIPPLVTSISRVSVSPTSSASVDFTVTFSEPVTGISTSAPFNDFNLLATGVTGASITSVSSVSTSVYTVKVNTGTGEGTIRLGIPLGASIFDLSGNPINGLPFNSGEVYDIISVAGAGVYDNSDTNWVYTGTWSALTGLTGPTNGTLHRGDAVGAKAGFTFSGTQFILKYTQNTNRGNIGVYVDGNLVTTINANGALQFQKTYASPVFSSGVHTVEFVHAGGTGGSIDVDSIEILNTLPAGVGVYDDAAAGWMYTGTWSALTGLTGPTNGTLHRGDAVGAKASFTFTGTQFILKYTRNTNRGNIGVYVDGNLVTTINANSGSLQFQQTYTSPIFSSGVHTVEFVHAGGNAFVDIDSVQILNTIPSLPDLVITNVTLSPAAPAAGQSFSVNITVENQGGELYETSPSPDKIYRDVYVDTTPPACDTGSAYRYTDNAVIPGGQSVTQSVTIPGGLAEGTHQLRVYVDVNCSVDETDDSNNAYTLIEITVDPATAPGVGMYDNADTNWVYTGTWSALTSLTGPTNGTLHRGDAVGAKAGFTFSGTQFILKYTQNTNRGNIGVYVDGNLVTTINANGALQFQKTYASPVFSSGVHTVEFVHAGGTGGSIDVDSIEILATTAPGVGVYDDAAVGWTYTGTWSALTGLTGPTNGTLHRGDAVGAKASFTFTGTQFILKYTRNTNRGNIGVYVDGNLVTTINANSGSLQFQQTYTSPIFSSGVHTVEFVHAGGNAFVDIDSVQILNTIPSLPDLVITNVTLSPAAPAAGQSFSVNITVENQGGELYETSPSPDKIYRDVYVDTTPPACDTGSAYRYTDNAVIPGGQSVTQSVTIPGGLAEGTHQLRVYVDVNCSVDETDDSNNAYTLIEITVDPATAPGVGMYDNADTNWVYTGTWSALTGLTGPTNGTLHRGDAVGAKAGFTFSGTQFILKYTQNTNRGNIGVYVDGNLVTTINANGALQFQKTYASPVFSSGVHTVEFVHAGGTGGSIDVDSIEILATTAPGVGVYDDAAVGWSYTGTWSTLTGLTGPTNGTLHRGDAVGAKASFTFTGTQFILKYTRNTNRGNIGVYVDGNLVTTINANSGSLQFQQTYTSPIFSSGTHTVEFIHAGAAGSYIDVDSIQIP